MRRARADSAAGVDTLSCKVAHSTKDGNPLGWRAHGCNARGQADHEELAHMVGLIGVIFILVITNLILFRETGVLDND